MNLTREQQNNIGNVLWEIKDYINCKVWEKDSEEYKKIKDKLTTQYILEIMEQESIYTKKEFIQYLEATLETFKR